MEVKRLPYEWRFWARPTQLPPPGDWRTWLILAGRGFGKTRTGAEWVRASIHDYPLTNVIAATADDARDIMIEGESGILAICPRHERPVYRSAYRRLEWPNGARTLIFTADEPERLRGKQHMRLWADEVAAWRYPEAWDQAMFGLRLGSDPRAVVTTTPKPIEIVRRLVADPTCHVTRGSTYDNAGNLSPYFFEQIIKRYEGTRIGRQELNAEILDDVEGALWTRAMIDSTRVQDHPDLVRVGIGVDPSGGATEGHDEQGIVAFGLGVDGDGYVLADRSCRLSPAGWGERVVQTFIAHNADRVFVEKNFGGDMAIATIEAAARAANVFVPVVAVSASRGKVVRSEPIAAMYEQSRIHHVGPFKELEDQMCLAAGTMVTTDSGAIPIEWIRPTDQVLTRNGYKPVLWAGRTGTSPTMWLFTDHGSLRCTASHPVYVDGYGFKPAIEVQKGDKILSFAPSLAVVVGIAPSEVTEPVYNLTVEDEPEFFANGMLVHNCGWVPGETSQSPDRLDALVWAATEIMAQRTMSVTIL